MMYTAALFAQGVLKLTEEDRVFSAAKLFFAYGLGNALSFPLSCGASTVLMAERPTPDAVFKRLIDHQPTLFCGVPTLYAAMLASSDMPGEKDLNLRISTSAGEALPEDLLSRWTTKVGSGIVDGIGSTEMLHIYLSNAIDDIQAGSTGRPVPGYDIKLVDADGAEVPQGEIGDLVVKGPSSAIMYWNKRQKSVDTFKGEWTHSGDKFSVNEAGYYVYAGRTDDMLKVSGIYVSPAEVEATLVKHPAVLEAAVVGANDENQLIKPKAYLVLNKGFEGNEAVSQELKDFIKENLAPHKYPRWFVYVEDLPKTATGKIQRFKLRELD
jgi:benzoate-CoA ligase